MARPKKVERALLDASVLLGVIKGEPEFACLRSLFAAVDAERVTLVSSTIHLIEVRPVHDADTEVHAEARARLRALLHSRTTELVDVSTVVAAKAADLCVALGLKTCDAIHLATAIIAKVDVLFVRDGKFPSGLYEGVYVTTAYDLDEDKLPTDLVNFSECS